MNQRLAAWVFGAVGVFGCGAAASCGGESDGDSLSCNTIPACYTEALDQLRACVPGAALTLMPVAPMSGVIDGLTCESGDTQVEFSPFSASSTGTVPIPSTVTIRSGGASCIELGSGTGTTTDGSGNSRQFTVFTMTTPAGGEVEIHRYDDGAVTVNCSPPSSQTEVVASAGALSSCPDAILVASVQRNDDASHMDVELLDLEDASSALFACD